MANRLPPGRPPSRPSDGGNEPRATVPDLSEMLDLYGELIHHHYESGRSKGFTSHFLVIVTGRISEKPWGELARLLGHQGRDDLVWICRRREEFESQVEEAAPELAAAVRAKLDDAFAINDGPPVVYVFRDSLFVTTCVSKLESN